MQQLIDWSANHKALLGTIAYLLLSVLVAGTPKSAQTKPWYGAAVWLLHRLSVFTHYDQEGTLQIPLLAKPIKLSFKVDGDKVSVGVAGEKPALPVPQAIAPTNAAPTPPATQGSVPEPPKD